MTNDEVEKLLAPPVLKWVSEQGWDSLRKIQEDAIKPILSKSSDVIITASTAGGKTEAAFLPIFTDAFLNPVSGLHTICISPLIALIRDQYRRLKEIGDCCNVSVTPWNGDVEQKIKRRFLKKTSGILIITPESLEAFLMKRSHLCKSLFATLRYIVVDELHSFIGTERGRQLQSLIYRFTRYCKNESVKIGLSATLYSMDEAFQYLSMQSDRPQTLITDQNEKKTLRLAVKCLNHGTFISALSNELYARYRGGSHLIFSNTRFFAEALGDQLRELCIKNNVPNEFFVHHSSLSKTFREGTERQLQDQDKPATAICTSTLELGIDIGNIDSVAQIGLSPSVSSLRQRLGRSGRKTGISTLRIYANEKQSKNEKTITDILHWNLFHIIAQVELLFEKWFEPLDSNSFGFSTLIQQMLSVIYQYGEVTTEDLWKFLCLKGTFRNVCVDDFDLMVQKLVKLDVLKKRSERMLVLGPVGEKITNDYDFYAIFESVEEYTLMCRGIAIGQYTDKIPENHTLIFGGLRWKIQNINNNSKIITVVPAQDGSIPYFYSPAERFFHKKVRDKVRQLFLNRLCPAYLNEEAKKSFSEAIQAFYSLNLDKEQIVQFQNISYWFPWNGDRQTHKLILQLRLCGLEASDIFGIISIKGASSQKIDDAIRDIAQMNTKNEVLLEIDDYFLQRPEKKYDYLLPDQLKAKEYCAFMYGI